MDNIFQDYIHFQETLNQLKSAGKKLVFTNGVFDIIHRGHVEYLTKAKGFGDVLIVGLNSDKSVNIIKGENRPIIKQQNRAYVLANLKPVDFVVIFDEDNPFSLIKNIMPDVLVKGGDWQEDKIIGADVVKQNGGLVERIKYVENNSSSDIIEEILKKYNKP